AEARQAWIIRTYQPLSMVIGGLMPYRAKFEDLDMRIIVAIAPLAEEDRPATVAFHRHCDDRHQRQGKQQQGTPKEQILDALCDALPSGYRSAEDLEERDAGQARITSTAERKCEAGRCEPDVHGKAAKPSEDSQDPSFVSPRHSDDDHLNLASSDQRFEIRNVRDMRVLRIIS